jgi:hypothetical protein
VEKDKIIFIHLRVSRGMLLIMFVFNNNKKLHSLPSKFECSAFPSIFGTHHVHYTEYYIARSAQPLFLKPLYQKSADFVLRYATESATACA